MRIVGEVEHPIYKITILHHMNRFTLQIEADAISQSYMLRESDTMQSASDVKSLVTAEFLKRIDKIFLNMGDSLIHLLSSNDSNSDEEGELIEGII